MDNKLLPYLHNISANILQTIEENNIDVINIIGESGSGKSSLLANLFDSLNNENEIVVLKGDSAKKDIDYYTLDDFLSRATKTQKTGKEIGKQLLEELPIVGKSLKIVAENFEIGTYINKKIQSDFNDIIKLHKDFSLYLLSIIKGSKRVFILCDDIQYFDKKTIAFLNDFIFELRNKRLSPIIYISTFNTSFIRWDSSLFDGQVRNIQLSLPTKDDIRHLMTFWGLERELSDENIEMIFNCTAGHLYLLHYIMEYLNSYDFENVNITNSNALMDKIVITRLNSFGDKYNDALKALCCLSNIGDQVSKTELLCALDLEPSNKINSILNISAQMNLLVLKDDIIFFYHEIIRKAFCRIQKEDLSPFFSKFSSCIKKISPSHYAKRAIIETKAANFENADILFTLYVCQKMRNGLFSEITGMTDHLSSGLKGLCAEFIENIKDAYMLTFEGKNTKALFILNSMSNAYPFLLLAEKEYLICTLQFKNNITTEYKVALQSISKLASELNGDEIEIWSRSMVLKMVLECELFLFDEARATRAMLQTALSKRLSFDRDAIKILNNLDLFSDTIDAPQVSHSKLINLVNKLEAEIVHGRYEQILELYIAECNLSGNSLIVGEYEKAYTAAERAFKLFIEFNLIRFPHPEVLFNNKYLSLLYMNYQDKNEVINTYKKLLTIDTYENNILITTNYAGLLLCEEQYEDALEILKSIKDEGIDSDIDAYYTYYYKFNHAIILYFNGCKNEAKIILHEITRLVPQVSRNLNKYYEKHYSLVVELLIHKNYDSIHELQNEFCKQVPDYISIIWDKYKRVYLFSDLQIWTQF